MWSNNRWTWDEIFATLSRERGCAEPLRLQPSWVAEGLAAVGALPDPNDALLYRIPITDGSQIEVRDEGATWALQLIPAPLPEVGWLPEAQQLGWIAVPACLFLLGALKVMT